MFYRLILSFCTERFKQHPAAVFAAGCLLFLPIVMHITTVFRCSPDGRDAPGRASRGGRQRRRQAEASVQKAGRFLLQVYGGFPCVRPLPSPSRCCGSGSACLPAKAGFAGTEWIPLPDNATPVLPMQLPFVTLCHNETRHRLNV